MNLTSFTQLQILKQDLDKRMDHLSSNLNTWFTLIEHEDETITDPSLKGQLTDALNEIMAAKQLPIIEAGEDAVDFVSVIVDQDNRAVYDGYNNLIVKLEASGEAIIPRVGSTIRDLYGDEVDISSITSSIRDSIAALQVESYFIEASQYQDAVNKFQQFVQYDSTIMDSDTAMILKDDLAAALSRTDGSIGAIASVLQGTLNPHQINVSEKYFELNNTDYSVCSLFLPTLVEVASSVIQTVVQAVTIAFGPITAVVGALLSSGLSFLGKALGFVRDDYEQIVGCKNSYFAVPIYQDSGLSEQDILRGIENLSIGYDDAWDFISDVYKYGAMTLHASGMAIIIAVAGKKADGSTVFAIEAYVDCAQGYEQVTRNDWRWAVTLLHASVNTNQEPMWAYTPTNSLFTNPACSKYSTTELCSNSDDDAYCRLIIGLNAAACVAGLSTTFNPQSSNLTRLQKLAKATLGVSSQSWAEGVTDRMFLGDIVDFCQLDLRAAFPNLQTLFSRLQNFEVVVSPGCPELNDDYFITPHKYSSDAKMRASLAIILATAAVAITTTVIRVKVRRIITKKQLGALNQLAKFKKKYADSGSEEDFNALYSATKKYNRAGKIFGWGSYDLANSWVNTETPSSLGSLLMNVSSKEDVNAIKESLANNSTKDDVNAVKTLISGL